MVKTNQNFTMVSGDSQILEFEVLDEAGVAVNITGATITWVLVVSRQSPTVLITKTTLSGITITNGASGLFEVALLPADTSALSGIYFHEAQVVTQSNNTYTVTQGNAIIEGDVI